MAKKSKLIATRLTPGAIYKLILIGFLGTHILFVLAAFIGLGIGEQPYKTTEGTPLTFEKSLIFISLYAVFGALGAFFWSGIFWIVIWPIFWLYSLWRPLTLGYIAPDE